MAFLHFEVSVNSRHLGGPALDDNFRLFVTPDVDSIKAVLLEHQRRVWSIDLESREGRAESFESNQRDAFRYFQLRDRVREVGYRHRSSFCEPHVVAVAQLNLRSGSIADIDLIAREKRQVLNGRRPFRYSRAKE
jgi:hypothetical protein